MKTSGLAWLAVLGVGVSLPGHVGAQEAKPASEHPTESPAQLEPPPSPGASQSQYDALIGEALLEYNAQNWAEAYSLFQKAHEASPNARTLRGLGVTSFELRQYPRAIAELSAALRHPNRPLSAAQRVETERLLERIARLAGTLVVTLEPAGAELSIDNEPTAEREITVPVGTVTLLASAPGYQTQRRVVTVTGGQRQPVEIRLSLADQPAAVHAPPAPPQPPHVTPEPSASAPAKAPAFFTVPVIAALSATAAGLVTLAIAGPMALSEESDLSDSCAGSCAEDRLSALDDYTLIADIGLGVALAGAVTAGVLIVLNVDGERSPAAALAPYLGPDGAGAVARGRF